MSKPMLVVHAGAGTVPEEYRARAKEGILIAIKKGWEILGQGGSALDAVEQSVMEMENFPTFNAGYGSVLTGDGKIEMDAMIMNGFDLNIGGVIAVSRVKNPIQLSRRILDKSAHVLFTGIGAEKFAEEEGFELIDPEILITERSRNRLEKFLEIEGGYGSYIEAHDPERREKYSTVGAVAMDANGNFAAATSTGGVLGKKFGRVGDTPIPGAGNYADDTMAISATGVGEVIIKSMLGIEVKMELMKGNDPKIACQNALKTMRKKVSGQAGVILVTKDGWSAEKTTKDLIYAAMTQDMQQIHDFSMDE